MENGEASFILVIQKHPKLMTTKAQAYQVRCVYDTPEKTVTVGFNVSMLTTAGTISNTGPPPVCTMKICLPTGQEVRSAVIGDTLMLKVEVQPTGMFSVCIKVIHVQYNYVDYFRYSFYLFILDRHLWWICEKLLRRDG